MESPAVIEFLDNLRTAPGWLAGNILDLRPEDAFRAGHLRGAAWHPGQQEVPSIFLPPRHEPLLVIAASAGEAVAAVEHFRGRGRTLVQGLALPAPLAAALPSDWTATGDSNHSLWKPPAWLARHEGLLPPPAAGPVLDLACGSGRAVVWMAEKGYRVTGIDWEDEALDLARQLASRSRVACHLLSGDLRDPEVVPPGPWAVVLNFRFRQPELLAAMPGLLLPGGVALVRTFRDAPGYEGHPAARHRLAPGELLKYFPAKTCDILAHEESHDPDGRPAAGIVARKSFR